MENVMRRLFAAMVLAVLLPNSHAATEIDCAELAVQYRDASSLMEATAFAQLRTCVDTKKWTQVSSQAPVSTPAGKTLRLDQGEACLRVGTHYAAKGPDGIPGSDRSTMLSCIDQAIEIVTKRDRPGHWANQPSPKRDELKT